MAAEEQTFTVTDSVSTETVTDDSGSVENLTPDEQESLAVGEKLINEQEGLLAGKYKTAEELEKAYGELERKLGEQDNQDSGETGEPTTSETKEVPEETTETSEATEENFYLEDGKVNYDTANEIYGDKLGSIFQESNIDPFAINEYFHNNNGTVSEEHYNQLESAGLSRQTIDAYLQGRAIEMGYAEASSTNDISDSTVAEVKKYAGGEEAYGNMVNWASNNLNQNEVNAFDEVINTGSVDAIKLAVSGLKSRFEDATGREGTLLTGRAPAPESKDVYRSQAELVAAMNDRRYDNDPAYRQDVIAKLERSDNLTF